jgi:hypothetical protein
MASHITFACARVVAALMVTVALGAAGPLDMQPQPSDVAPLSEPEPVPAKALTFQNTIYRAAPVPDPDAGPPANTAPPEAQVAPKFMSPRNLFQGDGYAYASSEQGTLDRRKNPAAGLGVSVPVN